MASVPFALSVNHFVNSVGADCGFAALIGLGILVLLYFAQARETSTLRDRLEESANRVAALEGRLAQLARAQQTAAARPPAAGAPVVAPRPGVGTPVSAPVRAAAPAQATGSAVASVRRLSAPPTGLPAGVLLGAPAGVGAPALTSATKLIPTDSVSVVPDAGDGVEDTVFTSPATAVAAGNGNTAASPAAPPPVAAPRAPAPAYQPPVEDSQTFAAPPRVQIRDEGTPASTPPRRTIPTAGGTGPRRPSIARRGLLAIVGVAIVAVIVIVLLNATGGGSSTTTVSHTSSTKKHHKTTTTAAFNPRKVTVSVLNGTAVNGLAAGVASALTHVGYKVPTATVTNAATQTQTTTIVGYQAGDKQDAIKVAEALKLSPSAAQPVGQTALQICQSPSTNQGAPNGSSTTGTCSAQVIVTVGSDLAGMASSTSTSG